MRSLHAGKTPAAEAADCEGFGRNSRDVARLPPSRKHQRGFQPGRHIEAEFQALGAAVAPEADTARRGVSRTLNESKRTRLGTDIELCEGRPCGRNTQNVAIQKENRDLRVLRPNFAFHAGARMPPFRKCFVLSQRDHGSPTLFEIPDHGLAAPETG